MVFESWPHLMDFMMKGLKLEARLESKPAVKLRPTLDTSGDPKLELLAGRACLLTGLVW
jgi:hypothetical protein